AILFNAHASPSPWEGEESKRRDRVRGFRVRSAKTLSAPSCNSDSHFKQPACKESKAPPPLFSQGAGSAGHFHPLSSRRESSLNKREGAERRKALVRNAAPRGRPYDRAGPSSGREL